MKLRYLQLILVLLILVLAIYFFFQLVLYLVVALLIATILSPLVNRLSSISINGLQPPRSLAVLFSFVVFLFAFALFVSLFIPLFYDQLNVLSSLDFNLVAGVGEDLVDQLEGQLVTWGVLTETGQIENWIEAFKNDLIASVDISSVMNYMVSLTGGFLVSMIAILFMSYFFLLERGMLRDLILSTAPNEYFELSATAIYKIQYLLTKYLTGLFLQMLIVFTMVSVGLSLFGVPYAMTVGVFAALANLIPYVGPMLGGAFGLLVGLSTMDYSAGISINDVVVEAIEVISVFGCVQLVDNIFLQPIIFSKSVKAHPLEIFVIIFAGGILAGPVGMIVAIPLYTVCRVVVLSMYSGYHQYYIFKTIK